MKKGKNQLRSQYRDPLPVDQVVPLPAVTLSNPLSLVQLVSCYLFPARHRKRHDHRLFGTLDAASRSVWVTDAYTKHRLWYAGFFGKGVFSRSELSWYTRSRRQLGVIGIDEKLTAEELTARRRVARRRMKDDRARAEREALEKLLEEEGRLPTKDKIDATEEDGQLPAKDRIDAIEEDLASEEGNAAEGRMDLDENVFVPPKGSIVDEIPDLEHMQLSLEEALFLSLALDTLDVHDEHGAVIPRDKLAQTCVAASVTASTINLNRHVPAESKFLISYAVYHHFRSLGWTPRSGIKFGVDWLLYYRGPVFSHAEFSIVVMPTIRKPHDVSGGGDVTQYRDGSESWSWLHTMSRVNSQAKKTLILCYVEVKAGLIDVEQGLDQILAHYRIRDVSVRRFVPSRAR